MYLRAGMALLVWAWMATAVSPAQTFTTLASFDVTNGEQPLYGYLAQGIDGSYYGATLSGGSLGFGALFSVTPGGALNGFYSFSGGADGLGPFAGVALAPDGNFYGTTLGGGTYNWGAVFKITPAGVLTNLYSFTGGADGGGPVCQLLLGANGMFYGTTQEGGANGSGTIFEITPGGTLTTLYNFASGSGSQQSGLIQAPSGEIYGTTYVGGAGGYGAIYKINARGGGFTTLHEFTSADGAYPTSPPIQGRNGILYGTTFLGGGYNFGAIYQMTLAGDFTLLYSFTGGADGGGALGGLLEATDGNLYGTTSGLTTASSHGTIFQLTPGGKVTTLYSFTGATDGGHPYDGLLQATDGNFYGTTSDSGAGYAGTVFKLSLGLRPLVKPVPHSGKVGTPVLILGNNLTGATSVSFSGVPAAFTVVSPTEITATVPSGAYTGRVQVVTPAGVLLGAFLVPPTITGFSPASGAVGTPVTISGEALTGATAVTFGGVAATSFTVNSATQITATVPAGAKSGRIGATTPSGIAVSAINFTVH